MPRRGPTPAGPSLTEAERSRFFDHLLLVAERTHQGAEALLRRRAVYLLGFDRRPQVVDWLGDEWRSVAVRRTAGITDLLKARSASVALASTGANDRLHEFVVAMAEPRAGVANLNYWAHWIGESTGEQVDDDFMVEADTRSWSGAPLLRHLLDRLDPGSPHLPLNLHTAHSLIASRPRLLAGQSSVRPRLAEVLERLSASDVLTRAGRDQVAGLHYALRMAGEGDG
ncbi:hypothetical protein [Actinokineospora sp. NBRC 105648]|uniref:hypothetical protein n=1 Tax=Actinokineospora sp. NBRC 105648 TaxID=3032206 RepID=UPI0024A16592|nr:hypothetical protein [Actinokineospora sp. NBRC 105648]GLZ39684.1 hypothetical protein Acsp05_33080 [Actinokineospora sp. NBRC 105648]